MPGLVDSARVSVIGGSHGGFLTGHLVGQHPSRFRCAGLRNPVLNIALMVRQQGAEEGQSTARGVLAETAVRTFSPPHCAGQDGAPCKSSAHLSPPHTHLPLPLLLLLCWDNARAMLLPWLWSQVGLTDIPDWCYVEVFGTEVGMQAQAVGVPRPFGSGHANAQNGTLHPQLPPTPLYPVPCTRLACRRASAASARCPVLMTSRP